MNIIIDGKKCACEKGELLLDIARRNRIIIPTLCHHEALRGQGSCRICIVEAVEQGHKRIVVSCLYPVEQEIEVFTDSDTVRRQRGMTLALLRKLAPDSERIASLCRLYKAPELPRLTAAESGRCILCGLCVRACSSLGTGAIALVSRGVDKHIDTPWHKPAAACTGCGACVTVCPTSNIEMRQDENTRTIWGKTFALVRCSACGSVIGTAEEIALASRRSGQPADGLCAECRRGRIAGVMAATYGRE